MANKVVLANKPIGTLGYTSVSVARRAPLINKNESNTSYMKYILIGVALLVFILIFLKIKK